MLNAQRAATLAGLLAVTAGYTACDDTNPEDSSVRRSIGIISLIRGDQVLLARQSFRVDGLTRVSLGETRGALTDLKPGMVVAIESEDSAGAPLAREITFNANAEGPISSIDPAAGRFIVLGQQIIVSGQTRFERVAGLAALSAGNVVEVSGLMAPGDAIQATFIELKSKSSSSSSEFEIVGKISQLDAMTKTFAIGSLIVRYGKAVLKDLPAGGLKDGLTVEVKGAIAADGKLDATVVEVLGPGDPPCMPDDDPMDKVEDEGRVEIFAPLEAVSSAAGTVTLLGITVVVPAGAELRDKTDADKEPLKLGDLAPGDWLEVRAMLDAQGLVVAERVEREEPEALVELEGPLGSFDPAMGTLVILGVKIQTSPATEFEHEDQPLTKAAFFATLKQGLRVKAKGSLLGSTIKAKEVEIEED